jgi:phytoene dehydrogenase-like protein
MPAEAQSRELPTVSETATPARGKIIIIGGGIAGLSCGCYLQMNGYQTEILEMNPVPGGLCTAWNRGQYVFDGCLRWLVGTHPSSTFHQVWNELGAVAGREIIHRDEFLRVEGRDGQTLSLPTDLDRLAENCKRVAPEDAGRLDKLLRAVRRCNLINPPLENPLELMSGPAKLKLLFRYLPMLTVVLAWKNLKLADYLASYRSQLLREALLAAAGDERLSALVLVMVLALRSGKNAGCVAGGSRAFSAAIAGRYARLGGVLRLNTRVAAVTVENGRATGVRCADGTVIPAATVISCADGHATIFGMLGGRYVNQRILNAYQQWNVFKPLIQVSLGINQIFPGAPHAVSLPFLQSLKLDDAMRHDRFEVTVFGPDSGFCPAGRTVMIARFSSNYEYWTQLKNQRPADYRKAKKELLDEITGVLDQRFPGLARHVDQADLATPATYERWTGNWQGSYQGWLPTPQILGRRPPYTLPGLKDFYMAGQWVETGGGLPPSALSGRYVAQMICARDGKKFAARVA